MLKVLIFILFSVFSQTIYLDTSVFNVKLKNEFRTFTFNGVLNPIAILSYNTLEFGVDLEIITFTEVKLTQVIVNTTIKSSYLSGFISFQLLLISDLPYFQVQNNINISRDFQDINITSSKNIVHTGFGQGNTAMNVFLCGWKSTMSMDVYDIMTMPYLDTNIYNIFLQFIDQLWAPEAWVIVTVVIMGESLIPHCPQSVYGTLGHLMFASQSVEKKQNFLYLFGITGVYLPFSKMRIDLSTNTVKVGMALFSFAYLSIDSQCYNEVAALQIPQLPPNIFQTWKIIVISVGSGIGLIVILVTIIVLIFCKKPKYQQTDENKQNKLNNNGQQSYNTLNKNILESSIRE